ncbi:hypothetical protein Tco_0952049 [Tanacetum coccineum]|uniref:ABC transmembrane type-1 domain-containing protein n=1 Tax=Tanacetum coccineum TaxID=301880 RepID=A0ABQ5E1Y2_9ASTR
MVFFGMISPNSFLSSILLLVVIIVMVVFVVVVLVVVVIAIVGVVIVVVFGIVVVVGGVSSIFKLSFVIVDSFSCYWSSHSWPMRAIYFQLRVFLIRPSSLIGLIYSNGCVYDSTRTGPSLVSSTVVNFPLFATGISLGPVFLLGLSVFAMAAVCASRAVVKSAISCRMVSKVMAGVSDVDVFLEAILSINKRTCSRMTSQVLKVGNIVEEENREQIRFLGGNSSSGTKKHRGSNSSDGGNTEDGVKIVGGVIGSGDEIEFSEELKDLLPAKAGK